jgi:hypothetical protein
MPNPVVMVLYLSSIHWLTGQEVLGSHRSRAISHMGRRRGARYIPLNLKRRLEEIGLSTYLTFIDRCAQPPEQL